MKSVPPQNIFASLASRIRDFLNGFRLVILLCVVVGIAVLLLTPWSTAINTLLEAPAREFERVRDVIRIIVQVGIGIIILIGISFLRKRSRVQDRTAGFERETRLSERFSYAVQQLGGRQTQVRLGGIYALDRIVREAPDEAVPVAGILSAFVREQAAARTREPGADVQIALTLLTSHELYASASVDLRRTVLNGADLNTANLEDARLDGADLAHAQLRKANLRRAILTDAGLANADLREGNLAHAQMENARLNGAVLVNAVLSDARLTDCDFSGAQLMGAVLESANVSRTILTDASLTDADLNLANLSGAALIRADLTRARMDGCNLTGTTATDCTLAGARLRGAFLFEANLHGVRAGGADFQDANLTGADLKHANLTGADLQNANLAGADLQQAHLFEANLLHADLTAANLRNAIGISLQQLFETKTLYRALLDDELQLQVKKEYPELLQEPSAPASGTNSSPQAEVSV